MEIRTPQEENANGTSDKYINEVRTKGHLMDGCACLRREEQLLKHGSD